MSPVTLMEVKDRLVVSGRSSAECRKKNTHYPIGLDFGWVLVYKLAGF